jgi:hypothetical protein
MPVNPKNKEGIMKVDIYRPIYEMISKLAKKQQLTIKDYINLVLETHAKTIEFTTKRFSEISQVGSTDTAILMEDKGKNVIASITMKIEDGSMFCSFCKKDSCEHIFKSLFLTDWIKIMKNLDRMHDESCKAKTRNEKLDV